MTRLQLTNRIRALTSVGTNDVSDADIQSMINEGILIVGKTWEWPFLHEEVTVDTVVSQETYLLASELSAAVTDFSSIRAVWYTTERKQLQPITYKQRVSWWAGDPPAGDGAAFFYMTEDNLSIGFVPVPNAVVTDKYTIAYLRAPATLAADGDSPEWDAAYHPILADFVAAQIYEREEFYNQADAARQRFASGMSEMKRYYNANRIPSSIPMIYGGGLGVGSDYFANMPSTLLWGWHV